MKQFKNILFVTPLGSQMVGQVSGLMNTNQSKLTLMSVAPLLEEPTAITRDGKNVDLQVLLQDEVRADLKKTASQLEAKGFRVRTVVATGDHAFIEIIKHVQSHKHDLVMMLADGISSIREQLFGTLSMHLLRKCPSAVWVVKPSRRRKLRNVFAAVDPDPDNSTRDQLNVEILRRASAVSQASGAKLHIIHAWNTMSNDVSRGRRWMTKQEIRLYVEKIANAHRDRLNQLREKHLDGTEIVHMIQGRPGVVIPETVAEFNCDLLVMGTVCRTGIPGFFIGNTAETILNQVDCSVLTVKPENFVSPIHSN